MCCSREKVRNNVELQFLNKFIEHISPGVPYCCCNFTDRITTTCTCCIDCSKKDNGQWNRRLGRINADRG